MRSVFKCILSKIIGIAVPTLIALCFSCGLLSGEIDEAMREELGGPVTVVTADQSVFTGVLKAVASDSLILVESAGAGSVEYTLSFADISTIELPGRHYVNEAMKLIEAENFTEAITVLNALYQQRVALLRWQSPAVLGYFKLYAQLLVDHGSLVAAIRVAESLKPYVRDIRMLHELEDVTLIAYYRLSMPEAADLATKWIAERQRYDYSALGYYVQAALKLQSGEIDQALHAALEPIVFSSQFPMMYLDFCYAIAIKAAFDLKQPRHARYLWQEMQERGLPWPKQWSAERASIEQVVDQ